MKEVFSMSQNMPICSLQVEPFASGYQVLASTANPSRLFHFSGGPSFATLFAAYASLENQTCVELPGDATATDLQLFRRRSPASPPTSVRCRLPPSRSPRECMKSSTRPSHWPPRPPSTTFYSCTPWVCVCRSFRRSLQVRSALSSAVVYERDSPAELRGLVSDAPAGIFWVFGDHELFAVVPAGMCDVDKTAGGGPRRVETVSPVGEGGKSRGFHTSVRGGARGGFPRGGASERGGVLGVPRGVREGGGVGLVCK